MALLQHGVQQKLLDQKKASIAQQPFFLFFFIFRVDNKK